MKATTRNWLLAVLCLAAGPVAFAADADADKAQLEKIKTLRTGLLNKMPGLNDLFDAEHNGVNAASTTYSAAYTAVIAELSKRLDDENAKPADAQDKTAAAAWNAKITRVQSLWSERNSKTWPAWRTKFNALSTVRLNLAALVADLAAQDVVWLRAECDRGLLVAVFTELDKRADEIKAQATVLVNDYIKQCSDDEKSMKD